MTRDMDAVDWLEKRGHISNKQARAARWYALNRSAAVDAEIGPGLRDILFRVAIGGEGMRQAEFALGWPPRSGKLVFAIACDRAAIAMEARRAETKGSVEDDSAGPKDIAR